MTQINNTTPDAAADDTQLLSPRFMHRLDHLDVMSRKILSGKLRGERRSKKRGQSVEFADYRQYVVGDDLRFIDWNLYARLDKLFLRLFMEEEDLSVSVLLDCSASMGFGSPSKLLYAKRVAAAMGYIGLVNYNRVNLFPFGHTLDAGLRHLRGRRPVPQLLNFLEELQPAGEGDPPGDLAFVCKRFALEQRSKGVVILISDFLDKGDFADAFRYLAGDRYDVFAIQLLAPEEIDPSGGTLAGDLTLRDIEDGDLTEVSITPALIKRYRANLDAFCEHLRQQCLKRDIAYLRSDTTMPFDTLVLQYLRERGLLG